MAWLRGCVTGDADMARKAYNEQFAVAGDANGVAMLRLASWKDVAARRSPIRRPRCVHPAGHAWRVHAEHA
jgi:hypothetical protein